MPREIHWIWLVAAALLLGGGLVWWMDEGSREARSRLPADRAEQHDRGPILYRWIDARGVVNITDKPPEGRRYTIVRIDPNRNIVPSIKDDSDSTAAPRKSR